MTQQIINPEVKAAIKKKKSFQFIYKESINELVFDVSTKYPIDVIRCDLNKIFNVSKCNFNVDMITRNFIVGYTHISGSRVQIKFPIAKIEFIKFIEE